MDSTDPALERIRNYETVGEKGELVVLVYQGGAKIDRMKAQAEGEGGPRLTKE